MDGALPLGSVRIMEDLVSTSTARPRMTTLLMTIFAGLATLLAAVGLYGVLAYAVSQRVREIGVRIAIGARPADVLAMVVRQSSKLAIAGLVIGLIGATRVVRHYTAGYGFEEQDGARACDCAERGSGVEPPHVLMGTVRVGDV